MLKHNQVDNEALYFPLVSPLAPSTGAASSTMTTLVNLTPVFETASLGSAVFDYTSVLSSSSPYSIFGFRLGTPEFIITQGDDSYQGDKLPMSFRISAHGALDTGSGSVRLIVGQTGTGSLALDTYCYADLRVNVDGSFNADQMVVLSNLDYTKPVFAALVFFGVEEQSAKGSISFAYNRGPVDVLDGRHGT